MRWSLKSPASPLFTQPFIQAQIKENIKAPRHWALWGVTGEFSTQRASNVENVSIWWRHHVISKGTFVDLRTIIIFRINVGYAFLWTMKFIFRKVYMNIVPYVWRDSFATLLGGFNRIYQTFGQTCSDYSIDRMISTNWYVTTFGGYCSLQRHWSRTHLKNVSSVKMQTYSDCRWLCRKYLSLLGKSHIYLRTIHTVMKIPIIWVKIF